MQSVSCPKCSHKFELSKALESEMEAKLRESLEEEQTRWKQEEASKLEKRLRAEAKDRLSVEMQALQESVAEKEKALREARSSELEVRRKMRSLEEKSAAFEIEKQNILDDERKKIALQAELAAEEKYKLKIVEMQTERTSLASRIDELQKKAEKTSQELQGTAQEIGLMDLLQKHFPGDRFERVGKGKKGGDVIHSIVVNGKVCARIVYESKRTAAWSNTWIEKLRTDRNNEKADLAIIVSQALPDSIRSAGCMEGIWICDFQTAPWLSAALRNGLIELARVRSAMESQSDMKDIVWRYLTGNEFKNRIERMLRTFMSMKQQIERERAQALKWLSERDQQLNLIAEDVNGFRGELEAMLQVSLTGVQSLQLAAG